MSQFSDQLKELMEITSLLHKAISENNYDLAQVFDTQRLDVITKLRLVDLSISERSQLNLAVDEILNSEKKYKLILMAEKEKTEQDLAVFLNKRKANTAYSEKH